MRCGCVTLLGAAADEDREGEEGAGARARRRRRKPSEVEDGQDVPADDAVDEEDEEEQDEEMVEGKMRFRGAATQTLPHNVSAANLS